MRRCGRFCDADGRFTFWRQEDRAVWLSSDQRRAVAGELRAQIARCRESGLPVTHVDTHHNVHNQPGIAPLVLDAARELGVPAVRVLENTTVEPSLRNRLSVRYFNTRLVRAGLARTRYFGTVDAHRALAARGVGPDQLDDFEVVTHPALDEQGGLVDALEPGASLRELMDGLPGLPTAVSYAGARVR